MQLTVRALVVSLAAPIAVLAACTSASSFVDSAPPTAFAPPSIPPSSGGVPPPDIGPRCPTEAPIAGTRCTEAATCSYGPDVRGACLRSFTCQAGRWSEFESAECAGDCPATFAEIVPGRACADVDVACSYEEGTCGCVADADAGVDPDAGTTPAAWRCVPPPTTPFCPRARPLLNETCVRPVRCDYGSCALGRALQYRCSGEVWLDPIRPDCEEP